MTQKKFQLFIFRRDLRIQDNTTLEVLHKFPEPIIPIFIFSPDQIDPIKNPYFSNNCVQFMCESLIDLNDQLNNRLNLFKGEYKIVLEYISINLLYFAIILPIL